MAKRVGEAFERPDTARSDPLMRERQRLAVGLRLLDDLSEELAGLVGRLVETDSREHDQSSSPLRTSLHRSDQIAELCLGSS